MPDLGDALWPHLRGAIIHGESITTDSEYLAFDGVPMTLELRIAAISVVDVVAKLHKM